MEVPSQLELLSQISQVFSESQADVCKTPVMAPVSPSAESRPEISLYKLEKQLLHKTGKAIAEFNMIQEGDRILVAISGGKDSWVMLWVLNELRKKAPINFDVVAVNIDQGYRGYRQDIIEDYVKTQGYEYAMEEFDIASIVAEKTKPGDMPCSLCARLRRGSLSGLAEKHKCNKIALGHHADDFIETLLLNIFYIGKMAAMAPVLQTEKQQITVFRPLVYSFEEDIKQFTYQKKFPIVCCQCPLACGSNEQFDSKRILIKKMLRVLEAKIPDIKQSLLTSLSSVKPTHLLDKSLMGV
ncbi:MAG: tRNA 2-thiocytidine(32) synthetase TtcA [Pseudomonadota bacterium]|nr:tRNA 2-thiocytidine(32) synthetase TtcA [Pseudomonadota bacterium]